MDRLDELLFSEQFNILEKEVKKSLEEDNNNSRLWYLLFLASNNNYINFDKDNLKNEIAYNKAIELASFSDEAKYKAEFYLYSNINMLPGFDKLFRYYQMKQYDECINVIKELSNKKYKKVSLNDKLIDSIGIIFSDKNEIVEYEIQLTTYNLLFIITGNEIFKDKINSLIQSPLCEKVLPKGFTIKNNREDLIKDLDSFQSNETPIVEETITEEKPEIEEEREIVKSKDPEEKTSYVQNDKKSSEVYTNSYSSYRTHIDRDNIIKVIMIIFTLIIMISISIVFIYFEAKNTSDACFKEVDVQGGVYKVAAFFPMLTLSFNSCSLVIVIVLYVLMIVYFLKGDEFVFGFFIVNSFTLVFFQLVNIVIITLRCFMFVSNVSGFKWGIIWPHILAFGGLIIGGISSYIKNDVLLLY